MIDYSTITADAGRGTEIGRLYCAAPLWDDSARDAYDAFASETVRQWQELSRKVRLSVSAADPFATYADMQASVDAGALPVLATATTGGHPYLTNELNDMFRAVHDYHGHYMTGRDFSRHGEEAAWTRHSRMYSPLARRAMTTETRGQTSALCWILGDFPPQKMILLPEWCTRL